MRHQVQKGFRGIFFGIPQHQKGYLVYVLITRKIIFSYAVVFYESFYSKLAYTSQAYAEAMAMHPAVSYIPCATTSREQTGNIIILAHSEEGKLLSETQEDAKSDDESDYYSIIPPLNSEEEMGRMDSVDESDDEPMSTEM